MQHNIHSSCKEVSAGMVAVVLMHARGLWIYMQGLGYSVVNEHNKKETLHLLRDVTGYFKRGEMAALVR